MATEKLTPSQLGRYFAGLSPESGELTASPLDASSYSSDPQNWSANMDSGFYDQSLNPAPLGLDDSGNTLFGSESAAYNPDANAELEKPKVPTVDTGDTGGAGSVGGKKVVSTIVNAKGENVAVYDDGTTEVIGQAVDKIAERKSAFDILKEEFTRYGLEGLVGDTQALAIKGLSPAEFTLELRQTETYKNRFGANVDRIKAGYRSLSEAEYITLEDGYQRLMREYGLPESFYKTETGTAGRQPELEKFIAGDVSPAELEDRIQLGVNRVQNASSEVLSTLEQFYPGVNKSNLLAYMLDPKKALPDIQRQVQAAEIGGAARLSGLSTNLADAQYLASYGVDQAQARSGYQAIAGFLDRGKQLAGVYNQAPYTQLDAEKEVFNTGGAADAKRKRQKISGLEEASFNAQSGLTGSALKQGRSGAF